MVDVPDSGDRTSARPVIVAAIAIAGSVILRAALEPVLDHSQVWVTFWPAMILSTWFGGWRAGLIVMTSAVAIVATWIYPHSGYELRAVLTGGTVFCACGAVILYSSQTLHRSRALAQRSQQVASDAQVAEHRLRETHLAFAAALSQARTPLEVARALVQDGALALGADVGVLARATGEELEVVAAHGLPSVTTGTRQPLSMATPLGAVLRTGAEQIAETAEQFRARFSDILGHEQATHAVAAFPLLVGDRVVGAAAFRFTSRRTFSEDERKLLRTLFAQTAQALERATLVEQQRVSNTRMRALVELATVIGSADTLDAVVRAVVSEGKRASSADTTGLYIVDDEKACLELVGTVGSDPGLVERLREVPLDSEHGRRLCKEYWVENQGQFQAAMPDLAELEVSTRKAQAFWSIPLVVEGRTRGVLTMGFFESRVFTADEREFARLFAHHCAQAIGRAERSTRLDRERTRLDRLFDANLIGTVFWERPGDIIRANESFLRSLGYSRADLEAGRVDWRALTPPDHAAADAAASASVRARGYHEPYEKEFVHRDGHRVPVLVSSAAFFDDRKKGVTYVADLTEVKRVAEAANRAKDEFLAMLGHELRNPLAPIMTALELIELRGAEVSERAIGIVRRQTLHLTRMVDDLLDVARIRAGKVQLRRRRTELSEIVRGAFETATPLLQTRDHRVIVDVSPTGLVVDVDPTRMGQVLSNILTNAAKYTDTGGTVTVTATRDASHATIEVTDTGIGIAPELLPRVFELFTQEAQNVDRSRGGLGLGLALARTFVELHGGSIAAHSEGRGRGTRVAVRLPLAEATERPALVSSTMPAAIPLLGKRRVLVVDDNSDAAEMLAVLAEHRGHVTRRANDGASALRLIEEFQPDVALLDLGLPLMDGFELAERIRRIPSLARIRLVAVTGYGLPSDRDRSRAAGFDLHLVKPLEVHDVIRAIEDATPSDVVPS